MKESLRYLNNAKEILKSVPVENDTYTDKKNWCQAKNLAKNLGNLGNFRSFGK